MSIPLITQYNPFNTNEGVNGNWVYYTYYDTGTYTLPFSGTFVNNDIWLYSSGLFNK